MRLLILAWLGVLLASPLHADEVSPPGASPSKSLFDTPLEDLLEIKVTTASKQAEPIHKSPAVLSIVTEKEIASYGALTLSDVLDRVTSVYMVGTLPLSRGMLSIRGDVTSEQNNHVLILLNGRPVRDSIYSGLNEEIFTAFPVGAIRQIEVIRGPGSVLYGTNAFVGVINLITKDASNETIEPTVRYGAFDTKQVSAFAAHRFGELELSGSFQYSNDRGWDFTAADWSVAKKTSVTQTQNRYTDTAGGTLLARYRKWTLNTYLGHEEIPFMSLSSSDPEWALSGKHDAFRIMADLGYEDDFTPTWKHTLNLTYNRLSTMNQVSATTNDATSDDGLVEWTHYLTFSEKLKALAGLIYIKQTGSGRNEQTGISLIPSYDDDIYSAYAQLGYQALDPLRLVLGAQAVQVPNNSLNVVPRLAAIYTFDSNWGLKALFSYAYRAPSESERHLVDVTPSGSQAIGDPGLRSERINTLDVQLFYQSKDLQGSATLFRSRQSDLINQAIIGSAPRYVNVSDETAVGGEIEGKYLASSRWSVQSNLTYQTSMSDIGTQDDGHIPNVMAKAGVTYRPLESVTLGVWESFFGAPRSVDNGNGATHVVNPDATYYNYLSANLTLDVPKLLDLGSFPEMQLQLSGFNLLDQKIFFPEYVYGIINTFPGRPGRALYAGLTMRF